MTRSTDEDGDVVALHCPFLYTIPPYWATPHYLTHYINGSGPQTRVKFCKCTDSYGVPCGRRKRWVKSSARPTPRPIDHPAILMKVQEARSSAGEAKPAAAHGGPSTLTPWSNPTSKPVSSLRSFFMTCKVVTADVALNLTFSQTFFRVETLTNLLLCMRYENASTSSLLCEVNS